MAETDPVLMQTTEMSFAVGVVLRKSEEFAQCVMLHSKYLAERSEEYDDDEDGWFKAAATNAIDSDLDISFTDDYIDILESNLKRPLVIPTEGIWTSGGGACVLSKNNLGDKWELIQEGTLFHYHESQQSLQETRNGNMSISVVQTIGEYCVSPLQLNSFGIIEAIAKAKQSRDDSIRKKISTIRSEIDSLSESVEVADPDNIAIFSGAEVQYNDEGKPYLVVPPKLVLSEKHGPVLVSVHCHGIHNLTRDYSGKALFILREMSDGNKEYGTYWIPSHFPLEETDEKGTPRVPDKIWKSVHITLELPHQQTTHALEEEKVVIAVNDQLYSATSDKELLVGNQGFGGVPYEDFVDVNNPDSYYEKDEGMNDLPQLHRAAPIVVAIDDLTSLQEIRLRLPGL